MSRLSFDLVSMNHNAEGPCTLSVRSATPLSIGFVDWLSGGESAPLVLLTIPSTLFTSSSAPLRVLCSSSQRACISRSWR